MPKAPTIITDDTGRRIRVRNSCVQCRRRKISCSRTSPCLPCVKHGSGDCCDWTGGVPRGDLLGSTYLHSQRVEFTGIMGRLSALQDLLRNALDTPPVPYFAVDFSDGHDSSPYEAVYSYSTPDLSPTSRQGFSLPNAINTPDQPADESTRSPATMTGYATPYFTLDEFLSSSSGLANTPSLEHGPSSSSPIEQSYAYATSIQLGYAASAPTPQSTAPSPSEQAQAPTPSTMPDYLTQSRTPEPISMSAPMPQSSVPVAPQAHMEYTYPSSDAFLPQQGSPLMNAPNPYGWTARPQGPSGDAPRGYGLPPTAVEAQYWEPAPWQTHYASAQRDGYVSGGVQSEIGPGVDGIEEWKHGAVHAGTVPRQWYSGSEYDHEGSHVKSHPRAWPYPQTHPHRYVYGH